jgi:hypothetical protein
VFLERWLGRILPLFCLLAALGPGLSVYRLMQIREFAKTFTKYGPLPEVRASPLDYMTLAVAIILLVAGVLEVIRLRIAAAIALSCTVLL